MGFAEKGIEPLGVIRIPIGNKRIVRKSLAEVVEVREVTLITAVRMSKERRLSLKKANPVEVVVIYVVAVEFFRGRGKTDGAPRGGGHQMSFCKTEVRSRRTGSKAFIRARLIVL